MAKITGFLNKVDLIDKPTIARENKVVAEDINEIKSVVNQNDDLKLDKGGYTGNAQNLKDSVDTKLDKSTYTGNARDLDDRISNNAQSINAINLGVAVLKDAYSLVLYRGFKTAGVNIDWNLSIKDVIVFQDSGFPTSLFPVFTNYQGFEEVKVQCIEITSLRADNIVVFPAGVDIEDIKDNPIDFSTPNMHNYISIRYLGNDKFQISNYVKEII